ncbi:linker histone h1 and h5 family domain-containing protein [Ditylenchus destructor]|uniref:Linker histone h1 and h5 family domain-containing protein n=1 Tax=Ditylenchus destructor TaxID=166010 RepID=A0AAD4N7X3_9BILA|nr:linker histone h1 and h5 family domain-containing protein [Ditylenchus destructor]
MLGLRSLRSLRPRRETQYWVGFVKISAAFGGLDTIIGGTPRTKFIDETQSRESSDQLLFNLSPKLQSEKMSASKNASSTVASTPATSAASKKTGNTKSAGPKAQNASVASHPTYADMVKKALTDLDDRKGTSRAAILKYVVQKFQVGSNMAMISTHLKQALKRGVATGALKQTKGTGASGSFRLGGKAAAKVAAVTHKTKAKKSPKKAAALENAKAAPAKDTSTPSRAQSTKKSAASKKATTPKKADASKKSGAAKKTAVSKKAAASLKKSPNKAVPKKTNSKKAAGDASSKA